jgi:L-malate glycosyltransferase
MNILFVGRMAPNKRVEHLLEAFAWYQRGFNPNSRLILVGSDRSCPRYYALLRMLALAWDLPNVCFERFASGAGLSAYYRCADLFVCASDHEGYCLPLVEAMHKGLPVMAKDTGGVPEALGGAGILYRDMNASELATLIHHVSADPALRGAVLDSQRRRMETLRARCVEAELKPLLKALEMPGPQPHG